MPGSNSSKLPLPYRIGVQWHEDTKLFVANIPSLYGLSATGHTADEAVRNVETVAKATIADMSQHGLPAPVPILFKALPVPTWQLSTLSREKLEELTHRLHHERNVAMEEADRLDAVLKATQEQCSYMSAELRKEAPSWITCRVRRIREGVRDALLGGTVKG